MKKFLISLLLMSLFNLTALSQETGLRLGLKLAPVLSSTRVTLDDPVYQIENDGSSLKLSFGLVVDNKFAETYAFSTGLIYIPKEFQLRITSGDSINIAEKYTLQYMQIPITLKLYTNELKPDLNIYFQLGGALEIKVFEEAQVSDENISLFQPIDIPVILGAGFEFRAGLTTTVFGGFSYNRGLLNTTNNVALSLDEDFAVRANVYSFDLGIKF